MRSRAGTAAVLLALAAAVLTSAWDRQRRGSALGGPAFLSPPPPTARRSREVSESAVLRQPEAPSGVSASVGAAVSLVALALGTVRAASDRRSRAQRRARSYGRWDRDYPNDPYFIPEEIRGYYHRNFYPGQKGFTLATAIDKPKPFPARQRLSKITEPIATFVASNFISSPFAEFNTESLKKVGSAMVSNGEITSPAALREYKKPKTGKKRLEQEKGPKRRPWDTEAYNKHVEKFFDLEQIVKASTGGSWDKDFITDRATLTTLLRWLDDSAKSLTRTLLKTGQRRNSIDIARISKAPTGKGLVMECIFEIKNMIAEFRPYMGSWQRSEHSQRGVYLPAWQRLASGDTKTRQMSCTGLWHIAGSNAGKFGRCCSLVEYELGDLSFLVRSPIHLSSEGKNVELKCKNYYYRDQVFLLTVYNEMLLGGVDMLVTAIHRSGKLINTIETTLEKIVEKQPKIVESAERRLGRLTALLKEVKKNVEASGSDGPWVLQWHKGNLHLGEYVMPSEEESERWVEKGKYPKPRDNTTWL